MLSAGFSLAFGSMFAKTYRINKIFTYSSATVVKDKLLRDKQLIMLILTLLLIDAIIVSLWIVIDPMRRQLYNLPLDVSSRRRGVVYQPQVGFKTFEIDRKNEIKYSQRDLIKKFRFHNTRPACYSIPQVVKLSCLQFKKKCFR